MEFHARSSDATIRLATEVRGDWPSPLQAEGLAASLGVTVTSRPMPSALHGVTRSATRVSINSDLTATERRFALAHELGHVMVRRRRCPHVEPRVEERFADRFARHLIAPLIDVQEGTATMDPLALAVALGTTEAVVLVQLAELGKVEALGRSRDGTVVCLSCGTRMHRPTCACSRYRNSADDAIALPLLVGGDYPGVSGSA